MEGRHESCHTHGKIELFQNPGSLPVLVNHPSLIGREELNAVAPWCYISPSWMEFHLPHYNYFSVQCFSRYFGNFMQKIFLVQRSPNPLDSPSCSPQVWRRNILCSLPACPPEVQLNFKLKGELFCISSLAFVASIFNRTSGLKSRG